MKELTNITTKERRKLCARSGTRTHTGIECPLDFKSSASTNSAIRAGKQN